MCHVDHLDLEQRVYSTHMYTLFSIIEVYTLYMNHFPLCTPTGHTHVHVHVSMYAATVAYIDYYGQVVTEVES